MSKLTKKSGARHRAARVGIGAAIAKRLAADGAQVAITYAKDAEGLLRRSSKRIEQKRRKGPSRFRQNAGDAQKRLRTQLRRPVSTFGGARRAGTTIAGTGPFRRVFEERPRWKSWNRVD